MHEKNNAYITTNYGFPQMHNLLIQKKDRPEGQ